MLLGKRAIWQKVVNRAVSALVVVVSLLAPVAVPAARQASDWVRGDACRMACCKARGRCSCRMSMPAAASGPAFAAPGCMSGRGASAQPGQFRWDLLRPVERLLTSHVLVANPLPDSGTGTHDSTWQCTSLWQRPPPFFRF